MLRLEYHTTTEVLVLKIHISDTRRLAVRWSFLLYSRRLQIYLDTFYLLPLHGEKDDWCDTSGYICGCHNRNTGLPDAGICKWTTHSLRPQSPEMQRNVTLLCRDVQSGACSNFEQGALYYVDFFGLKWTNWAAWLRRWNSWRSAGAGTEGLSTVPDCSMFDLKLNLKTLKRRRSLSLACKRCETDETVQTASFHSFHSFHIMFIHVQWFDSSIFACNILPPTLLQSVEAAELHKVTNDICGSRRQKIKPSDDFSSTVVPMQIPVLRDTVVWSAG